MAGHDLFEILVPTRMPSRIQSVLPASPAEEPLTLDEPLLAASDSVAAGETHAAGTDVEAKLRVVGWSKSAPEGLVQAAQDGRTRRFLKHWRRTLPKPPALKSLRRLSWSTRLGAGFVVFDPWLAGVSLRTTSESFDRRHAERDLANAVESLLNVTRAPHPEVAVEGDVRRNGRGTSHKTDSASNDEESLKTLQRSLGGGDATGPLGPVELLTVCDLLLFRASNLPEDLCIRLWLAVFDGVGSHQEFLVDPAGCEVPYAFQAAASGELLWKAGLLLAGVENAAEWREAGRARLIAAVQERSDEEGRPAADATSHLASELGLVARSVAWGNLFAAPLFEEDMSKRFADWARSSLSFGRAPCRVALSAGTDAAGAGIPLLDFAAAVAGLRVKSRPRQMIAALAGEVAGAEPSPKVRKRLVENVGRSKRASFQSDVTSVACLRNDWTPDGDLLAIRHDDVWPVIDLSLRGHPVFHGPWELEVRRNGVPVPLGEGWKATCWFSDADADYLELQQILPDGTHIERQMLLARKHHTLVLADCVSNVGTDAVELRSRLHYAPNVAGQNETATRECWLQNDLLAARIFPLALEDDRLHRADGSLVATDSAVELRQTSVGGLFAPLVVDWHPKRANVPADWRKLTVSEDGKSVGIGHASGHRVRIGEHQLVVYRSLLRNDELRTVLGYHTPHETMFGLFDKDGDIHPLVLVE